MEDRHVGIEDFVFFMMKIWKGMLSQMRPPKKLWDFHSIATDFRGVHNLLAKREKKREQQGYMWNAIKETPNLDERACYKALSLLNTNTNGDAFLKMSPEERSNWISYNLE
ncbi:unnamed protein product [Prunus brigantina]